jgi:hypothetical protein
MAVKEMSVDGMKGIMNNDSISGRPSHIGRRNRKPSDEGTALKNEEGVNMRSDFRSIFRMFLYNRD